MTANEVGGVRTYAVAMRHGTEEEEYSDTIFVFGEQGKVFEWLKEGGAILQKDLKTIESAKRWFFGNYGTYNNFDYKTKILA
jgi:hypothetical protein